MPSCRDGEQLVQRDARWTCADAGTGAGKTDTLASLDCADGEVVLFERGRPRCGAVQSAEGGDITAVHTPSGSGLLGGDSSGAVTLGVDFGGGGDSPQVARADHGHAFSALGDVPAGFADRIDDDVLGRLDCSSGETAVYDGARSRWSCGSVAAGAETDPSVNDLARSHMLDACAADQVPVYDGSDWVCATPSDHDSLTAIGSCSDGDTLVWQSGGFSCGAGPSALGDVTSVTVSGPGLVGGGQGGDVQLSLAFPGGACASGTVACSDHTHPVVTPSLASVLGESNDAAGQRVENLAPPVGSADAVTKAYVDALGSRGSAGVALALCCGSECASRLDDWVCQDVAASGKAVVPMSDARGMIVVPDTGRPKLIAQGGVTQDLDDCTGEWKICTLDGVTSLIAACGLLPSTTSPSPFQCWVPTLSYFMLPGMSGLFRTGTPAAPEIRYLADDGSDVAPPDSQVDCSAVTPFEEPFPNSRMVVCVR